MTERTQGFSPETKIEEQNFFLWPSPDEREFSDSDLESRSLKFSDGQNSTELDDSALEKTNEENHSLVFPLTPSQTYPSLESDQEQTTSSPDQPGHSPHTQPTNKQLLQESSLTMIRVQQGNG